MTRPKYTFEFFKQKNFLLRSRWYWRIRHRNTQILCVSEAYTTFDECKQTPINIIKAIEETSGKQSKNWTMELSGENT